MVPRVASRTIRERRRSPCTAFPEVSSFQRRGSLRLYALELACSPPWFSRYPRVRLQGPGQKKRLAERTLTWVGLAAPARGAPELAAPARRAPELAARARRAPELV